MATPWLLATKQQSEFRAQTVSHRALHWLLVFPLGLLAVIVSKIRS